jgi:hypothetical protein
LLLKNKGKLFKNNKIYFKVSALLKVLFLEILYFLLHQDYLNKKVLLFKCHNQIINFPMKINNKKIFQMIKGFILSSFKRVKNFKIIIISFHC